MKKVSFIFSLIADCFAASAQTGLYDLAAVPEALKAKASVIVHQEDIRLDVESLDKSKLRVQKVYTVLSEDGKAALLFNEYSSKAISLDEAELKVYDQAGKQTGRYRKKDMTTVAIGEGLVEDGYMTYYQIAPSSYPITIAVSYEQTFKTTLFVPSYRFVRPGVAVIESNYTARVPSAISLRYKTSGSKIAPAVTEEGNTKIYKWTVKNLTPVESEQGGTGTDRYPLVKLVTEQFSHYGFRGDLSSWKSFGAWLNDLYNGLDALPADRVQFFQNMVKDASTDREKAARIYRYLQENFRYVSIQLGIGGLRPFSATFTDQKKYGDCKGLSTYMKAALKSVGIRSHVAIINAEYNQEPVDPEFPANGFNHAILCVPNGTDSIWLECTSSTTAFGTLGTNTENRNALLITEDGGRLVATPKSKAADNTLITRTTVTLDPSLAALTETALTATGEYRETMNYIMKEKRDDQKEALVYYLGYRQPDDFELTAATATGRYEGTLKMQLAKAHEFNAGAKYFMRQRINKMWTRKMPPSDNRKSDYYFYYPFENKDTTMLKLPAGFKPDVLPKEKKLMNEYGLYASKTWFNESENAIYTATTLTLKKHKVLAADYPTVKAFFDEVASDDSQRIVLAKTAEAPEEKKAF